MIREGANTSAMSEAALRQGFADIIEDGRRKVIAGITTVEEVERCGGGRRSSGSQGELDAA